MTNAKTVALEMALKRTQISFTFSSVLNSKVLVKIHVFWKYRAQNWTNETWIMLRDELCESL